MSSKSRDCHGEKGLLHSTEETQDCPGFALYRAGTFFGVGSSDLTRPKRHMAVKPNCKQRDSQDLLRRKMEVHCVELTEKQSRREVSYEELWIHTRVFFFFFFSTPESFERETSTTKTFRKNSHLILSVPHRDVSVCTLCFSGTWHTDKEADVQAHEKHAVSRWGISENL